jgi:hypothetical protein
MTYRRVVLFTVHPSAMADAEFQTYMCEQTILHLKLSTELCSNSLVSDRIVSDGNRLFRSDKGVLEK